MPLPLHHTALVINEGIIKPPAPPNNPLTRPYFLVETHGICDAHDTCPGYQHIVPATRWRNFFVAIRLAVDVMKRAQVTRHQIGWMKLIEHQDVGPDQNVRDISKKQDYSSLGIKKVFFV